MEKYFRIIADAEFEAKDLAHAFGVLAQHFDSLRRGTKPKPIFKRGDVQIRSGGGLILPPGLNIELSKDRK